MAILRDVTGGVGSGGAVLHETLPDLQGTGPEHIHLNQAEYDALSFAESQHGVVSLGTATTTVSVTFGTAFTGSPDYLVFFSFINEVDTPPNIVTGIVVERTLTSMTIRIAGVINTSNYKMFWKAFR